MKIIKPDYYKNFRCIAGACPDSCCQGWEVDADPESLKYYSMLDKSLEIKKRIDSVLDKDEFNNTIFRLAPRKRCPFLNDENLCDMHIAIGGEHTPFTCRNFPRFIYDFGAVREMGISFSCPVAAELIYNHEGHIMFDEENNSDLPSLNDIDALTYYKLRTARQKAYDITFDATLTISERLIKLLELAASLQKELDDYTEGGDSTSFFDVFVNPELINPEWDEKINNPVEKGISNSQANENIIVYFIYKYFMQAIFDLDVLSKVKMAVVGVLVNTYLGEDCWTMHLWSKETEHSQYNMDRYTRLLKEADSLSKAELIKRLK